MERYVSNGHDYVEIAGINWAMMNIGATGVTDTGLYFQWGDTQGYTADQVGSGSGQKAFIWEDYKYWTADDGSGSSGMTKYNSSDGKTVLDASDDAVQAAWGGGWRIPTKNELVALGNAVNTAWTEDYQGSGVAGLVCTDKTDSSKVLFFPAAGVCSFRRVINNGSSGCYWSSSNNKSMRVQAAFNLLLARNYDAFWDNYYDRYEGITLRGVLDI